MTPEMFQNQTHVSRETLEKLHAWQALLTQWNRKINLVARSTIYDFWLRHALDSWQVFERIQTGSTAPKNILDMGAGAGFPGIAIAIGFSQPQPDASQPHIHLVEANGKKCNFLRTVIRELALPATVHQTRIENYEADKIDIITARAFAPLDKLLSHSLPFFGGATTAIFPKGENWQDEVNTAQQNYKFDLKTTKSQTNNEAKILCISNLTRLEDSK